jgi:hypothetical protein
MAPTPSRTAVALVLAFLLLPDPVIAEDCFPSNDYLIDRSVAIEARGYVFGSGVRGGREAQGNGMAMLNAEWCGSGFVVGEDGSVLTNWHVARHMLEGQVRFDTGAIYPIRIIKSYNTGRDLAMLKIASNRAFPTVDIDDSDTIEVRDHVLAVGNPGCRGINMTEGRISQIVRDDYGTPTMLNHTAVIQGGNSGGPLLRCSKVVGVNSAGWLQPDVGSATGFNIAIPINDARTLLSSDLMANQVTLVEVFSPDTIAERAEQVQSWAGTVPAAASSEEPGLASVAYTLAAKEDYLLLLIAPQGVDLDLIVGARGSLIGLGALPANDLGAEPLLLNVPVTLTVEIGVMNAGAQPSQFGLSVNRIKW